MSKPRISIIVAMDRNRAIGKTTLGVGKLLWDIPVDLKRFRELTSGHPIIMGRKTFESILSYRGKALPNRTNIVITRDKNFDVSIYENTLVCHSIEEAFRQAQGKAGSEEIFIIGGGQIYSQGLPFTDRLYLTLVDGEFNADTYFPDYSDFKKKISEESGEDNGYRFKWITLER